MSWNLFEKIINVIKPCNKSEQTSEAPDVSQPWPEKNGSDTSQSWPEKSSTEQPEQPEASQEPSPTYQETPSSPQRNDCQQD